MIYSNGPNLKIGEVALLQVDPNTGTPVDESGNWLQAGQARYLRFESEAEARKYALSRLELDELLEWSLFDHAGCQISVIHNQEALREAALQKRSNVARRWFGF